MDAQSDLCLYCFVDDLLHDGHIFKLKQPVGDNLYRLIKCIPSFVDQCLIIYIHVHDRRTDHLLMIHLIN